MELSLLSAMKQDVIDVLPSYLLLVSVTPPYLHTSKWIYRGISSPV
jgi:hypothetical protein